MFLMAKGATDCGATYGTFGSGFRCQRRPKGRTFKTAILKARRFRDRANPAARPRPFCRTREQTMIEITRRQAIGTMGTAAAFATGLGRPLFAETAAGSAGIDQALTAAVKS